MVRFWKIPSALVIVLLILSFLTPVSTSSTASASNTASSTNQSITIYFFYKSGCPHCAVVEPLVENLTAEYPQVNFIKLEVGSDSANKALWLDLNTRYNVTVPVVPEVFIGGQVLVAENAIQNSLEPIIINLIDTNNTTSPLNNSTKSANIIKGAKPTSEASTVIEVISPEIEFTTANGSVFNSSQVTIHWNYTSGQSNLATANVAIDNGAFNSIGSNATSYVASGLSAGNHTFDLRITDEGNLSSEHILNFTVDLNSQKIGSQISSTPLFSNPLLIGLTVFIVIVGFVGLSLVLVRRKRRKAS